MKPIAVITLAALGALTLIAILKKERVITT